MLGWFGGRRPPLLRLGDLRFPLDRAAMGILLTGGTGAGKSTAMRELLGQLMLMRSPMAIACVKPDEADQIECLARRMGGPRQVPAHRARPARCQSR